MNKLAQTTARKIQTAASGSGMRAHQLFDKLVEAIYCSCALTAPTSQKQIDNHADRYEAVVESIKSAGLDAVVHGDLLVSFATSIENGTGDFLGDVAAQLNTLDGGLGQFFTPFEVSRLVCGLTHTADEIRDTIRRHGYISLHEPTAGSGGMILAFADQVHAVGCSPSLHLVAHATELEATAFHMCYAQLSLRDIPACVTHGNTLTQDVISQLYTPAYLQSFRPHQEHRQKWSKLFALIRSTPAVDTHAA